MRCPLEFDRSAELIVGYGARTLDPATAAAFERHIVSCAECRAAAELQKAVWAAMDESQDLRVSPDFDRRVFERIAAAERRGRWLWQVLVPAVACTVLAAVLLLRQPDSAGPPPVQPAVQMEQVEHALDDMDLLKQLGAAI
jgi:hypothetical protein